jgi:glucose/arabinose dehydrogenase/cytochrome c553
MTNRLSGWVKAGVVTVTVGLCSGGIVPAFSEEAQCPESDSGLSLPRGFCATIFADNVGHARQLAVTPDGTVYVNTWSGIYYGNDTPHEGGFLIALKDTKGRGQADVNVRFGPTFAEGAHGGTGIWLYKNWLYAEIDDKIVRYELKNGAAAPTGEAETILSGMPITGDHPMHGFAVDAKGNLFVEMGTPTNACEKENRMPHSPGVDPCPELETRGGIWRYDASKIDQVFSPKERYATGNRNAEGFDFDSDGRLYITQHGRDQLHEDWPELYTAKQGWEQPSEEVVILKQDANYGWPYCYYDPEQKKLVLAPEYGGDGGKKVGRCDTLDGPVASFPAHWAPNDLKIYKGSQFPKAYQGGAFIAFHGSWNRAPGPQGGYNVLFQPLADGKTSGDYVVFADGFAGPKKEPGGALHRPSGLAVGPDGALYITDDKAGRIWRVTYNGDPNAPIEAAPAPTKQAEASPGAFPPEGVHPNAGLPVPPGATGEQVALGQKIFHGEVAGGTCAGCHGADGIGTPVGADLASGTWLWVDGSLQSITDIIRNGVPKPKQHPGAMPPFGGVPLSDTDLASVAAYVWAIGHQKSH